MPRIRATLPGATALIIGEGPERPGLEMAVRDLGLEDGVTFFGWVQPTDIADYLAASDIFVGPSKRTGDGRMEAQGLTFIEAMMSRTPVVATRCGGIVDAVHHEDTGLLVAENAPEEIADAVVRLCRDSELARRLSEAGYALAMERFSRKRTAETFSRLFLSLQ